MLEQHVCDQVFPALAAGRYSLLLGAGFSCKSKNGKGDELPSGSALAVELAKAFSLPEGYPLAQLAETIDPEDLRDFLINRFAGAKASLGAQVVPSFVWRAIYTFNIDDVLADCYSSPRRLQRPLFLTFRDVYQRPEDPQEIVVTHLHGYVKNPNHGFVFSSPEYGETSGGGFAWFNVLADELMERPFIIVGCSLSEPDVEAYLARRKGIPSEAKQLAPSLFVTNKMDPVLEKRCKRFGLIPVEAESETFFQYLDNSVENRKSPLDLLGVKASVKAVLTGRGIDERSLRVFFRQWLFVDHDELPRAIEATPLLAGSEPSWDAIREGQDVIRSTVGDFVRVANDWKANPKLSLCVLESPAGEGKSTALRRMAVELSRLTFSVYYYNAYERLVEEDAFKVIAQLPQPPVLVIDDVADHAPQLSVLLDSLAGNRLPCLLITASRRANLKHFEAFCSEFHPKQYALKGLSNPEGVALVKRLRQEGRLGRNAGQSDGDLAKRIVSKQLLAAVVEVGGEIAQFDRLIQQELLALSPSAQLIYRIVAFAHSVGLSVKVSIVLRASQLSSSDFFSVLHGELKGIVLYITSEYLETRHRVVAEHVARCSDDDNRFTVLVGLANAIAQYVNRKTIMRGTQEARLSARLMDFDDCVRPLLGKRAPKFYEAIQKAWEWNSRYWEQRSLLMMSSDVSQAVAWAQHAVGIEKHPHTLTTLAKVIFKSAEIATSFNEVERVVQDALATVDEAIATSTQRKRMEIHPFDVAVRGTIAAVKNYQSLGGQRKFPEGMLKHVEELIEIAKSNIGVTQAKQLEALFRSAFLT